MQLQKGYSHRFNAAFSEYPFFTVLINAFSSVLRTCSVHSPDFLYAKLCQNTSPCYPLDDDGTERIQRQVTTLEELEKALAKRYGMVGIIDPVEVFDEAKRRAFAKDVHFEEDLRELDRLNHLRLQLARLRLSRTVSPPTNVSVSVVFHGTFISTISF